MKRILTMAAVAAVLCTMLCSGLTVGAAGETAASEPMKIRLMQGFNYIGKQVGDNVGVSGEYKVHITGDATATLTESLGALGATNAVTLNSEAQTGFAESQETIFEVFYQSNAGDLADLTGWMAYVKMPINKSVAVDPDTANHPDNRNGERYSRMYIGHFAIKDGAQAWPNLGGAKVQFLEKNSTVWQTVKANDGFVDLPNGFEGYIKVSLSELGNTGGTDGKGTAMTGRFESTAFKYRSMGGEACGPAVINAVYGIVEDSDSVTALLDNEEKARFLTNGKAVDEADSVLLDAAMKGRVLQSFNAYAEGADLMKSGGAKVYYQNTHTATAAAQVGGIENSPSLKLDGTARGGFRDGGTFHEVYCPKDTMVDDMKGFMFYVKCAKPHPDDTETSRLKICLYTEGNAGEKWTQLGSGKTVKILAKGSKKWMLAPADDDGILILPANFEGYILYDINDMTRGSIVDDMENRKLISVSYHFHGVGGDVGACYLDSMYAVTDMGQKDIMMSLNGCDVYNLTTGALATREDLMEKGPEIGEKFDDIPEGTLTEEFKEIGETDITADSVKLSWTAINDAAAYRVDVFRTEAAGDGISLKYVCVASEKTAETGITINGLEANTRYYVVVSVLDEYNAVKDTFDYQRFMTADKTTDSSGSDDQKPTDKPDNEDPIPDTGVPMATGALVMVVVAAGAVTLTRKKQIH